MKIKSSSFISVGFQKVRFLLVVKHAEVSYFISTWVICMINKASLDVFYNSCERLDHTDFYPMEVKTYIL